MKTPTKKQAEKQVEQIFYKYCSNRQIPMLKLPLMMKLGMNMLLAGASEAQIGQALLECIPKGGV